jgi:hypothetical protein
VPTAGRAAAGCSRLQPGDRSLVQRGWARRQQGSGAPGVAVPAAQRRACVRVVASLMANGTLTRRASVLASSVLPQPVGPCRGGHAGTPLEQAQPYGRSGSGGEQGRLRTPPSLLFPAQRGTRPAHPRGQGRADANASSRGKRAAGPHQDQHVALLNFHVVVAGGSLSGATRTRLLLRLCAGPHAVVGRGAGGGVSVQNWGLQGGGCVRVCVVCDRGGVCKTAQKSTQGGGEAGGTHGRRRDLRPLQQAAPEPKGQPQAAQHTHRGRAAQRAPAGAAHPAHPFQRVARQRCQPKRLPHLGGEAGQAGHALRRRRRLYLRVGQPAGGRLLGRRRSRRLHVMLHSLVVVVHRHRQHLLGVRLQSTTHLRREGERAEERGSRW